MIDKKLFESVYDKFKFEFYKKIFARVKEREGSLSAMEAFSLEVINMLGEPTISDFADFIGISQSNATYKVNCLIEKGYIVKENSKNDRREYHLILSEKFRSYVSLLSSYEDTVLDRIDKRFPPEDIAKFNEIMRVISEELMPESTLKE